MSNVKITQLPLATTPLTGTEVFPLVQGTTTKQVSITGLFTSPVMTNPTLGTVGQADLINATGLPISTGVAGLGTGIATFLGTPSSANLRAAVTDETGTGSLVFANSPTLITPNLGTPSAMVATNITGTALGLIAGSAVTNANLTGAVTSIGNATSLGSFTSAQLATALTDETGSGVAVFATSPTLVTPDLGTPSAAVLTNATGLPLTTGVTGTLGLGNGGTGQTTANAAFNALAPSQTGNSGKYLTTDGTNTSWGTNPLGTVTSVDVSGGTTGLTTSGGPITTSGTITLAGTLAVANGGTGVTTSTGTGSVVLSNSPTLVTPALGTPASATLTNATGLPISTGVSGLGTGVATALAVNVGSAGAPVVNGGALGTPSSGTVTNLTGTASININGTVGATTPTTGAFTTVAASGSVTLSGGTANGVTYLNGSKQLVSGSALTFDGTNLGVGATTVAARVDIVGGADNQFRLSSNETNATTKEGKFLLRHYTNAQPNFLVMYPYSTSTDNAIFYGGGSSAQTAATFHAWMTAANNTTVSGTEQMRLTSTGLGIGTSSPSTKLTVYDATTPQVTFNNGTSTFIVGNNSSGNNKILYGTGAYPMIFYTNATEAMRIDSSQNVGIGVTPSTWNAGGKVVEIGATGLGIWGNSTANFMFVENAYYNGGWKYASTNGAAYYQMLTNSHVWYNAASGTAGNAITFTQAMTLDASGNLGVGTTSPSSFDGSADNLVVGTTSGNNGITIAAGTSSASTLNFADGTAGGAQYTGYIDYQHSGDYMRFGTNGGTERMRIDSSGSLLVGLTSASSGGFTSGTKFAVNAGANLVAGFRRSESSGTNEYIRFTDGDDADCGSIDVNATANTTAYNTSSDYRLKQDIAPMTGALAKVAVLNPCTWNWKHAPEVQGQGFIAHELAEVVPDCVTGVKDEVDQEGNPVYQGIDTSFLVATLTAAIQEQQAIIESLKARLDAANL